MESQAVGEGATYPVDEVASKIAVQQITPEPGSHPARFNDGSNHKRAAAKHDKPA